MNQGTDWKARGADKKVLLGIIAILLNGLGIHKFMMGYSKEGIIQIVATFLTCGFAGIVGIIEGVIYLTKSDEDFVKTYIEGRKGWF
jgi:TM2 domain-containing membrane protein YozV